MRCCDAKFGISFRRAGHDVPQLLHFARDTLPDRIDLTTFWRKPHDLVPGPREHPDAEVLLELRDLAAERGLRPVQRQGRLRHVEALFDDFAHGFDLVKVHHGSPLYAYLSYQYA